MRPLKYMMKHAEDRVEKEKELRLDEATLQRTFAEMQTVNEALMMNNAVKDAKLELLNKELTQSVETLKKLRGPVHWTTRMHGFTPVCCRSNMQWRLDQDLELGGSKALYEKCAKCSCAVLVGMCRNPESCGSLVFWREDAHELHSTYYCMGK
jgi:hypothetical protein